MEWLNNISVSLAYSTLYFISGLILIGFYTIFIYRTTLPPIGPFPKVLLILIRTLILVLLLALIFDPVLKISSQKKNEPKTLVFIDNSKSIAEFANKNEVNQLSNLPDNLSTGSDNKIDYFTFGSSEVNDYDPNNDTLNFKESSTDYSYVVEKIKQSKDVASVVIVSDGIINQGKSPQNELNKLGIPVFTLGIGDTSITNDLLIEQMLTNSTIYADVESEIEILLKHSNLDNIISYIQVFDNDSLFYRNSLTLGNTGIDRIRVPYKSSIEGTHNITVRVNADIQEDNTRNNTKSTLVNILPTKKKITLLSGSPDTDYSVLKQTVSLNEDYEIHEIIELGLGKFLNNNFDTKILTESDIIFFIGFPNKNTDDAVLDEVISLIQRENKPFLFAFGHSLDFNRLRKFEKILPFNFAFLSERFLETEVTANKSFNSLLGNSNTILQAWENLPPITIGDIRIEPNVSSEILLVSKETKFPIIFTNSILESKSIIITAINIWKWKLKAPEKDIQLFNNFVLNAIKWLSLRNNDYFTVSLEESNFRSGEVIKFSANLYNTTFEPLSNEKINLTINNSTSESEYLFEPLGNGLYEANINLKGPGLYKYTASIEENIENLPSVKGTFNIAPLEIELIENKLNREQLESISSMTGGNYYNLNEIDNLSNELNLNYKNKIYFDLIDKELRLSNIEIILLIIVLLFSIEWITRKVLRMI